VDTETGSSISLSFYTDCFLWQPTAISGKGLVVCI